MNHWSPGSATTTDTRPLQRVQQLADTLDIREQFTDGAPLPPLWHWSRPEDGTARLSVVSGAGDVHAAAHPVPA